MDKHALTQARSQTAHSYAPQSLPETATGQCPRLTPFDVEAPGVVLCI